MYTLKILSDAYKFTCFKIIDDHMSELNQKILRAIRAPTWHGTEHDFSRDTEKETNIEIGRYNKMDEFPKTYIKTTGNSQFTLKSLLPVDCQ